MSLDALPAKPSDKYVRQRAAARRQRARREGRAISEKEAIQDFGPCSGVKPSGRHCLNRARDASGMCGIHKRSRANKKDNTE